MCIRDSNWTINSIVENGMAAKIYEDCLCPECGSVGFAWYELPDGVTMYDECEHTHDGVPKRK